jgi:hypothetical protein
MIQHTDSTQLPTWKPQTVLRLADYCFRPNYPKRHARFSALWHGKWNGEFPTGAAATLYMATLLQMLLLEVEDVPLYLAFTGLNGHASLERVEANELSLPRAAEFYASHGIPIFPLAPRSKQPLKGSRGFYDATTDLDQIRRWWSQHPEANIGCPMGEPSGRWLLDFDSRSDGLAVLADQLDGRILDGAATVLTGGNGRHVYYAWNPGLAWLRCGEVTPGVELKVSGGYSVLPPSIHPSGSRYLWLSQGDLERFLKPQSAPDWLLQWLRERRKVRQMPPAAQTTPAGKILEGRRNTSLTAIAGVLRRYGAGEAELHDLLGQANVKLCEPPLDDAEVARIAQSVARYEPAKEGERPDSQRIFEQVDEGHYRLLLPGIASELEIDLLRRENSGLVGELTVRCNLPGNRGSDGVLSIADLNVSSARARVERAKLIASRANTSLEKVDWTGIIEEFCQRVVLAEKEGEPAIDLADADPPEPDAIMLVDGFPLFRNHPVILFGDGASCKSLLALYFAWRLTQRGQIVLYADWELDAAQHRARLGRIAGDLSQARGIKYVRCRLPLRDEAERLRRLARQLGATYLICDSVALGCDGPPEVSETAMRYFQALRRIGLGCLLIAHVAKGDESEKTPFGSVFWPNSARATWLIKRTQPVGNESVIHLLLTHKKANLTPTFMPLGYEVCFAPGSITIRRTDPGAIPEFADKMTVAQRMLCALRQERMTIKELSELLAVEESTIRSTLTRRKDLFVRLPDGRIGLAGGSGGDDAA